MTKKQTQIEWGDYKNYPEKFRPAYEFMDDYENLPDGAYFELAREKGVYDLFIEMDEWEVKNTNKVERLR